MGTSKTRGVTLAAECEVPSSSPARLAKRGECGQWEEVVVLR